MSFLGELMNIGLINSVNYVECLYDLEGGAETEKYVFVNINIKISILFANIIIYPSSHYDQSYGEKLNRV